MEEARHPTVPDAADPTNHRTPQRVHALIGAWADVHDDVVGGRAVDARDWHGAAGLLAQVSTDGIREALRQEPERVGVRQRKLAAGERGHKHRLNIGEPLGRDLGRDLHGHSRTVGQDKRTLDAPDPSHA
jgi:hypothetical protein